MPELTEEMIEELKSCLAMAEFSGFKTFAVPCWKMNSILARLADLERLREAVEESSNRGCELPVRIRHALAKLTTPGEMK